MFTALAAFAEAFGNPITPSLVLCLALVLSRPWHLRLAAAGLGCVAAPASTSIEPRPRRELALTIVGGRPGFGALCRADAASGDARPALRLALMLATWALAGLLVGGHPAAGSVARPRPQHQQAAGAPMKVLAEVAFVLGLMLLNGALAMSELAMMSSRRGRLEQLAIDGDRGAGRRCGCSTIRPASFHRPVRDHAGRHPCRRLSGATLGGHLAGCSDRCRRAGSHRRHRWRSARRRPRHLPVADRGRARAEAAGPGGSGAHRQPGGARRWHADLPGSGTPVVWILRARPTPCCA